MQLLISSFFLLHPYLKNTIYFETVCIAIKYLKRYNIVFEFSDYQLFHTADPNNDSQYLSPVAFGTTTGLLVAIIVALSVVVILQCVRKRNGNGKTTMMAYFSPLHPSQSSLNDVNMQNNYIDIQDNYVNMQNNYVDKLKYVVR